MPSVWCPENCGFIDHVWIWGAAEGNTEALSRLPPGPRVGPKSKSRGIEPGPRLGGSASSIIAIAIYILRGDKKRGGSHTHRASSFSLSPYWSVGKACLYHLVQRLFADWRPTHVSLRLVRARPAGPEHRSVRAHQEDRAPWAWASTLRPEGYPPLGQIRGWGEGLEAPREGEGLCRLSGILFSSLPSLHLHTQAAITEGPSLTFPPTSHPASTSARSTVPVSGPRRGSL